MYSAPLIDSQDSLRVCSGMLHFSIQRNRLFMPPYCIGALCSLISLKLSDNEMTTLIDDFGNLTSLQLLEVARLPMVSRSDVAD